MTLLQMNYFNDNFVFEFKFKLKNINFRDRFDNIWLRTKDIPFFHYKIL